jgi:hypothetical protein
MTELIEATKAIMVYDDEGESLCVSFDKSEDQWINPQPLSKEDIDGLIDGEPSIPIVLPPQMLWYEEDLCMIWTCKPVRLPIKVNGKMGVYSHPHLVFKVTRSDGRDSLSVATLPTDFDRSVTDSYFADRVMLLELPYKSIDVHGGTSTMGSCNVTLNNPEFAYSLPWHCWEEWERTFFNSEFNYRPTRRNHLKETNKTLTEWIQCIN